MSKQRGWHNRALPQNQPRSPEQMAAHLLANRVITENGCWNWTGLKSDRGYGKVKWRTYGDLRVHRVAAVLWMGMDLRDIRRVCHRCDNPACFNPDHLFIGTDKDNQVDCVNKGRHFNKSKTACSQGHEYTPENTWLEKTGARHCRTCHRQREAARHRRLKCA